MTNVIDHDCEAITLRAFWHVKCAFFNDIKKHSFEFLLFLFELKVILTY